MVRLSPVVWSGRAWAGWARLGTGMGSRGKDRQASVDGGVAGHGCRLWVRCGRRRHGAGQARHAWDGRGKAVACGVVGNAEGWRGSLGRGSARQGLARLGPRGGRAAAVACGAGCEGARWLGRGSNGRRGCRLWCGVQGHGAAWRAARRRGGARDAGARAGLAWLGEPRRGLGGHGCRLWCGAGHGTPGWRGCVGCGGRRDWQWLAMVSSAV